MGLFGASSPYDTDVDKATSEKNTSELWDVIIDICDKVNNSPNTTKDCLKSIIRRIGNDDPHVALQAITLLDACVKNCGKPFHLEVASRDFETEFRKLLSKSQPAVANKMKLSLKKWVETTFKTDPQLSLIPALFRKLKEEGQDFTDSTLLGGAAGAGGISGGGGGKALQPLSKDPNVVSSQQEEDDIAKAIELSLKDKGASPKSSGKVYSTSIYPSMSMGNDSLKSSTTIGQSADQRKVRALYDFEAAEDNELTFMAGEIIHVIDDSDQNWWKGFNHRGEGLFPSNFVTADLSVEPKSLFNENKAATSTEFSDEQKKETESGIVEIDEEKIDRLLHLLHEANPEDASQDSLEMLQLEAQVNQMLPLIDMELERVDRRHAQLTQLSKDLVEANNLYHLLMREPDRTIAGGYGGHIPATFPSTLPQSIYGQQQPAQPPSGAINTPMYSMPNMYLPPNSMAMAPSQPPSFTPHSQMPFVQQPQSQMASQHYQTTQQIHQLGQLSHPQQQQHHQHQQQQPLSQQPIHLQSQTLQHQTQFVHQQHPQQQQQQQHQAHIQIPTSGMPNQQQSMMPPQIGQLNSMPAPQPTPSSSSSAGTAAAASIATQGYPIISTQLGHSIPSMNMNHPQPNILFNQHNSHSQATSAPTMLPPSGIMQMNNNQTLHNPNMMLPSMTQPVNTNNISQADNRANIPMY